MGDLGEGRVATCTRCGKTTGVVRMLGHVLVHVLDLAIAAGVAAVVTAAMVPKHGVGMGIVFGAMMGLGLASFRERGRGRMAPRGGDGPGVDRD